VNSSDPSPAANAAGLFLFRRKISRTGPVPVGAVERNRHTDLKGDIIVLKQILDLLKKR
jgi:hypothetical protein